MRLSGVAMQPATPRPDDPSWTIDSMPPAHVGTPHQTPAPEQQDITGVQQHQPHGLKPLCLPQQQDKQQQLSEAAADIQSQESQGPSSDNAAPAHAGTAHATVIVGVGGKSRSPKHKASAALKLSQQAIKCLETYEHKLLLDLQAILEQNAANTASCAAAGAAVGAGAAVAAAERALAGRAALLKSGLLSPPDSARSARAWALQEFRRQPGAVCAAELQGQMLAQLEAAEAKLHVHRTAASSAKVKILQLEELVQQLQLKHSQQQEQLSHQQQHMDTQQEQLQQQEAQMLEQEQTLQQQQQLLQQQRQGLELKEQQLVQAEQQLQDLKEQLQQQELEQWRTLSTYSSLDEQDLRQQQERLLQEREEQAVLEQQLHWRQEQLELQHQNIQQQQEEQQGQLQQMRAEARELQQERDRLLQQQRQLEHQQQELQLLQQQAEQQKQDLAQQHQLLHEQQAELELQLLQASASQHTPSSGRSSRAAAVQDAQAGSQLLQQQQQAPQRKHDVPPLPLYRSVEPGLLQQVAQTLASPPPYSPELAPAGLHASTGSSCSMGSSAHMQDDNTGNGSAVGMEAAAMPAGVQQEGGAAGSAALGCEGQAAQYSWSSKLPTLLDAQLAVDDEAAGVDEAGPAAMPATYQQGDHKVLLGGQQCSSSLDEERAPEEQQQQDEGQQQQRQPRVPLLHNLEQVAQEHHDWQVIPSPSSLAPADKHTYHASAFTQVLRHLVHSDGRGSSPLGQEGEAVVLGEQEHSSEQLQGRRGKEREQQQQDDLLRVAEYLHALASDNTVLSCEVFHLQKLLVEQRRSASSRCEAIARKLASEAVRATWQAQQAELRQELQQATIDAVMRSEGSSCASMGDGGGSGDRGGASDVTLTPERIAAICSAVRERLSDLLESHDARVQDLLEQLDQEVEACCAEVDEAASESNLEQQLSTFQEVYEGMLSESEASSLHHQRHDSAAPSANGSDASAVMPTDTAADHLPPGDAMSPRVLRPGKPFVTSPSGHVSLVPSRRTSAAQQSNRPTPRGANGAGAAAAGSEGGSSPGCGVQFGDGVNGNSGSGPGNGPFSEADSIMQGPAAALFRRKSRLGELPVGSVGGGAISIGGSGGGGILSAVAVGMSADSGSRVSKLARLFGAEARSLSASLEGEPGQGWAMTGVQDGSHGSEQQHQEDGGVGVLQGKPYSRSRTPTMDVLGEVAERLRDAAGLHCQQGEVPHHTCSAGTGGGSALQAAARALNGDLSSNGSEAGCSAGQQGSEERQEQLLGQQEQQQEVGWEPEGTLRAPFGRGSQEQPLQLRQQQGGEEQLISGGGVDVAGRPAPSAPALMLVKAIQEAAMAVAAANGKMA